MLVFWFIVVVSLVNLFLFSMWSVKVSGDVLMKMYLFISVVVGAYIVVTTTPSQMQDLAATTKQVVEN